MCDVISTVDGEVSSTHEMNERGWIVTEGDIDPAYFKHWTWDELRDDDSGCLCPVLVEQVLDRCGVEYEEDFPWGWAVAPLKGDRP